MKKQKIIGVVKEAEYDDYKGDVYETNSRTILTDLEKIFRMDARFDCPCCGKGISIRVEKIVPRDEDEISSD